MSAGLSTKNTQVVATKTAGHVSKASSKDIHHRRLSCLPLQQVDNEHIKVKVVVYVGSTFGLQTC